MIRVVFVSSVLFLFSCSGGKDRIIVPELQQNFYEQALERINKELAGSTDDLQLVEQKIYYCDRLGWPVSCLDALDELKKQKGMTPILLERYMLYYQRHEMFQQLLELVDRWGSEFGMDQGLVTTRINSLTQLGMRDEAFLLLRNYLSDRDDLESMAFAATQYLVLEDTLMGVYYLNRLRKLDATHPLVRERYGDLMLAIGYPDLAIEQYLVDLEAQPDLLALRVKVSNLYSERRLYGLSRDILLPFVEQDAVTFRVADLFRLERKWDSAHYYLDQVIARDSLSRQAWWTKAQYYEERGWLSSAANYYNHLTYLNPEDTEAIQKEAEVRRKIAYLQRLKFEENQIAPPVIESKKIQNNE